MGLKHVATIRCFISVHLCTIQIEKNCVSKVSIFNGQLNTM